MNRTLLGLLAVLPLCAAAKAPELVDIKAYPTNINLATKLDRQSVIVQALFSDSTTQDITDKVVMTIGNKALVSQEANVFRPLTDGQTDLKIAYQGKLLTLPVKVEKSTADQPVSFSMDIMPVFLKAGCNTGGCHGSARGKDGFRLSLFGFDPDGDYHRLTRELLGRRINIAVPDDSLLLEKSSGRVPHTGGERFKSDSPMYKTVVRWMEAGAPADSKEVAKVVGLEIHPVQAVLEGVGSRQRLNVRALYSDGTDRDVTDMAVYLSNNDVSAKISTAGEVTAEKRGEAFILARYEQITVGAQILVIPNDPNYAFPSIKEHNYIDQFVHNKLKKVRLAPSELCDDATFLRRVSLDIVGKLPTMEEVEKFSTDADPKKREKQIDALLVRREFGQMWVMKFAELLQVRTENNQFQYKSALAYYEWLADQFIKNRPMNELVQELIMARGGTFANPAGNFYKVETDTLKLTENVAQVFMGMRIQCAQCHNHPFDRWKMDDYYSFAAFFAQVGRKTGEDPRETIIFNSGSGGVRHPVGNRDMLPKFLGGDQPPLQPGDDRREAVGKWLVSAENPFFAKNLANIVWAHFMGRGIVEPVDDVRISNPASNPELLEALGKQFTASNYDFRKLVKDICNSRTYQLTIQSNATNTDDTRNFSKAYVRRVRAEVLLDCINQVTDSREKFPGLPLGSGAVEIVDGRTSTFFLTTFGRASRDTVCSCEVKLEPNLSQALHLLNGDTVNNKIVTGGVVQALLKAGEKPAQIIEKIYLRAFSRKPTIKEMEELQQFFKEGRPEAEVLNDLFWSLLNSKEFVFNH